MEIRKAQGWPANTPMEFFAAEEGLVIRKYATAEEEQAVVDGLKQALDQTLNPDVAKAVNDALEFIEGR